MKKKYTKSYLGVTLSIKKARNVWVKVLIKGFSYYRILRSVLISIKENSLTYIVCHLSSMDLVNWCACAITNNNSKKPSTLHFVYCTKT